jgi:site-specific DNA-methyltransferase (adenine-specific)
MEFMKGLPDNHFDLSIVDPPYGIHEKLMNGAGHMKNSPQRERYKEKQWDKETPTKEYFAELFRISETQMIWGGNYFDLPPTRGIIAWVKPPMKNHPHFSQWEMCWTSKDFSAKVIYQNPAHMEGGSIHPTQKPIGLYKKLLRLQAKPGDTIFDSHVGSGSIRIACHDLDFEFTGCEIDADYHAAQEARFQKHCDQLRLF